MGEIIGFWTNSIGKLFIGSGFGGFCAYFNLSQVNVSSLTTSLQAILGLLGAIVAITYGIYQIIRIHRQLKEKKK